MKALKKDVVVCIPDKGGKVIKLIGKYMPRKIFYNFAAEFANNTIKKRK